MRGAGRGLPAGKSCGNPVEGIQNGLLSHFIRATRETARGIAPVTGANDGGGAKRRPGEKLDLRGGGEMHLDPGCRPRTPFYRFPDSFYRILQSSSLIPTTPESASESAGAAAVTLAEPRKDPRPRNSMISEGTVPPKHNGDRLSKSPEYLAGHNGDRLSK